MSWAEEFEKELNKKKKEKEKETSTKTQKNKKSGRDDWGSEFEKALNEKMSAKKDVAPVALRDRLYDDDIAPTKETKSYWKQEESGNKDSWVKSGVFADGWQSGDVAKGVLGTLGDVGLGAAKGIGRMAEGLVDLGTYGVAEVAEAFGADKFAEKAKKVARYSATDEWTKGATDFVDKYSFVGNKGDMISEGLGQVGAIILTGGLAGAAGLGAVGTTAVTTGAMGLSSAGTNIGQAYGEGATDGEAWLYGLTSGAIEAGTEMLFGGLGKGVKALGISRGIGGLDDMFAKKLSSKVAKAFTNEAVQKAVGNTVEFAVKSSGEGFEEK